VFPRAALPEIARSLFRAWVASAAPFARVRDIRHADLDPCVWLVLEQAPESSVAASGTPRQLGHTRRASATPAAEPVGPSPLWPARLRAALEGSRSFPFTPAQTAEFSVVSVTDCPAHSTSPQQRGDATYDACAHPRLTTSASCERRKRAAEIDAPPVFSARPLHRVIKCQVSRPPSRTG
jgi:hypothetical protein